MKNLLKIVAIVTLGVGLGAISLAQDAGPQGGQLQDKRQMGHRGGMRMMEKIEKDVLASLKLSDVQKNKVADLQKDRIEKLKALRKSEKGTPGNEKDRAAMKKIRQEYDSELKDVIGSDNWRKYKEGMLAKMKELREKRKEGQDKP